jgi:hypothetical protein
MFSDICSYLYEKDYNVFLHWSNTKFDNSSFNSLDYFLKQEYPENYDVIQEGKDVSEFKHNVRKYFDSKPSTRPEYIKEFNDLFWGKFKLSDKLQIIVDDTLNKFNNKKTLAVHIRRADIIHLDYFKPYINFDINNLNNYYEIIKEKFVNGGYEKIFLCSDEQSVLDFLVGKFGDIIIYNNNFRNDYKIINSDLTIENMYGLDRSNNGEKLLLEIMSDALISSKCDGFLGTVFSGFSMFIEIFNNNKFKEINYF